MTSKTDPTPGLLGICYDAASSFLRGPAEAPSHIRDAFNSPSTNLWTESGVNLGVEGAYEDLGDLDFRDSVVFPKPAIETAVSEMLGRSLLPICLGGDHSITYPIIRAVSKRYPNLTILQFDAHPDLYDELYGNPYSHACPFARIMEEELVDKLVQIGIRTANGHQRDQADRFGVKMIEMLDFNIKSSIAEINSPLYISVDMDVLDPAFAPGVSHHEPGGLSTRDLINIINGLDAEIVGADIVELNPERDAAGITAAAAGKILKEIMGKCISG